MIHPQIPAVDPQLAELERLVREMDSRAGINTDAEYNRWQQEQVRTLQREVQRDVARQYSATAWASSMYDYDDYYRRATGYRNY